MRIKHLSIVTVGLAFGLFAPAFARKPPPHIDLSDSMGAQLRIYTVGPKRVEEAVREAAALRDLDAQLATRGGSARQLPLDQLIAAEEFRDVALSHLNNGVYIANNTSAPAMPSSDLQAIREFSGLYKKSLESPWQHNAVSTKIKTRAPASISYMTYRDRQASTSSNLAWLPYTEGQRMNIRAYVFRIAVAGATACEVTVPVWDDPTEKQIDCAPQ